MAKMTTPQKIAWYREQIENLEAQASADLAKNDVVEGDNVTFKFGRGDTRKELTGKVLGVKDEATGRWLKVASGEGFDLTTYTIRASDLTANTTADARRNAGNDPLEQN